VTDQITITRAVWKPGDFRVDGTASRVGETVSVRTGSATGPVIGAAVVTAAAPPGDGRRRHRPPPQRGGRPEQPGQDLGDLDRRRRRRTVHRHRLARWPAGSGTSSTLPPG
jgi:hypothetical protein